MHPRCFLLLALLLVSGATTEPSARVVLQDWAAPRVQEFDPKHPPADLPMLAARHAALADARPFVFWEGGAVIGDWNAATRTLTLAGVEKVTISGGSEIRLPADVAPAVREHEGGHDALNALEWNESARKSAEQAAAGLVGRTFAGEGNDNMARSADAWKKAEAERDKQFNDALAQLLERMGRLGDRYDALTDHGRSRTVDTTHGVAATWRERKVAAATQPGK